MGREGRKGKGGERREEEGKGSWTPPAGKIVATGLTGLETATDNALLR